MASPPLAASKQDLDSHPSPTGAKTLALLGLLDEHPAGLSAAEATRLSGITGNLVFRILKTFAFMGYAVQREDDKRYTLSNRLLDLSRPKVGDKSLVVCAQEVLRSLRDDLGETVQLVLESDGKALLLEQFHGIHPLQVIGRIGMRCPLYSCAPGKAILAFWGEARRNQWFEGRSLESFTPTTLSRREDLEGELERARLEGYAVDRAEGIEGIHCVAAPVLDEYGNPVAAITMIAPMARLPESRFGEVGRRSREAARQIEGRLRL